MSGPVGEPKVIITHDVLDVTVPIGHETHYTGNTLLMTSGGQYLFKLVQLRLPIPVLPSITVGIGGMYPTAMLSGGKCFQRAFGKFTALLQCFAIWRHN